MNRVQNWEAKVIHREKLLLGEAAFWHPELQRLLYVDIEGEKLAWFDPVSGEIQDYLLDKKVGTIVPAGRHEVIIAVQGSLTLMDLKNHAIKTLITLEDDKPANRCNDGKCDALGRLWFGTMHIEAKPGEGSLYCYDGQLTKMLDQISISNGVCWSPDNTVMYHTDSLDKEIKAFDFNLTDKKISNPRVIIKIEEKDCLPDGMCVDLEGMLWVAIWGGGCVNRYNPVSGELIGTVKVNAPLVTSCAFGGRNMTELYITTASKWPDSTMAAKYPDSGSVFVMETGIKGLATNFFRS